jgi:hypothetical protein
MQGEQASKLQQSILLELVDKNIRCIMSKDKGEGKGKSEGKSKDKGKGKGKGKGKKGYRECKREGEGR